jgi:hypothetical protein
MSHHQPLFLFKRSGSSNNLAERSVKTVSFFDHHQEFYGTILTDFIHVQIFGQTQSHSISIHVKFCFLTNSQSAVTFVFC